MMIMMMMMTMMMMTMTMTMMIMMIIIMIIIMMMIVITSIMIMCTIIICWICGKCFHVLKHKPSCCVVVFIYEKHVTWNVLLFVFYFCTVLLTMFVEDRLVFPILKSKITAHFWQGSSIWSIGHP